MWMHADMSSHRISSAMLCSSLDHALTHRGPVGPAAVHGLVPTFLAAAASCIHCLCAQPTQPSGASESGAPEHLRKPSRPGHALKPLCAVFASVRIHGLQFAPLACGCVSHNAQVCCRSSHRGCACLLHALVVAAWQHACHQLMRAAPVRLSSLCLPTASARCGAPSVNSARRRSAPYRMHVLLSSPPSPSLQSGALMTRT